jgi:hypothetical protein
MIDQTASVKDGPTTIATPPRFTQRDGNLMTSAGSRGKCRITVFRSPKMPAKGQHQAAAPMEPRHCGDKLPSAAIVHDGRR